MAAAASVPSDTDRLEAALAAAGLPFELQDDRSPARYSVVLFPLEPGEPLRLEFVLWPLGAHRLLWRLLRRRGVAPNPGEWGDGDQGVLTVALGYDRSRDLYVAWPALVEGRLRAESSLWVRDRTVRDGAATGYMRERRGRRGATPVVFRADEMERYVREELARGGEYLPYRLMAPPPPSDTGAWDIPGDAPPAPAPEPPPPPAWEPPPLPPSPAQPPWPAPEPPPAPATPPPVPSPRPDAVPAPSEPAERPVVETGFAALDATPSGPLGGDTPLEPDTEYAFWFAVGTGRKETIETTPRALPSTPHGAVLAVQIFGFEGELELIGTQRGEFELDAAGRSRVVERAALPHDVWDVERTLYFVVRTPTREGDARLRCNVYLGSTLLQSRLVTARIGGEPGGEPPALRSDLDYHLTDAMTAERLADIPAHRMSLMVNGIGGSHQFRFYSAEGHRDPFVSEASIDAFAVQGAIGDARGALQEVAWNAVGEWDGKPSSYCYGAEATIEQVTADLTRLAIRGHRLYTAIGRELAGGFEARKQLQDLMRTTGEIQIATTAGGLYLPAALFYDHPLEDLPAVGTKHRLCPELAAALEERRSLDDLVCLRDGCPHREDLMTVCASGFWGYRHDIGWPVSTAEPLTDLPSRQRAAVAVGISTDPELVECAEHIERLRALADCQVVESRDALTEALRSTSPNVIYLYCHGGVMPPNTPYLEIGPAGSAGITESYFDNYGIRFATPLRPLVFVNGCHTTALDPAQVMNLVNGFVQEANAVGVVGTELTVFEPLAVTFAEALFESFLAQSSTIGTAVRRARIALLQQRNPLGLVYVPFVAAPTRLVHAASGPGAP